MDDLSFKEIPLLLLLLTGRSKRRRPELKFVNLDEKESKETPTELMKRGCKRISKYSVNAEGKLIEIDELTVRIYEIESIDGTIDVSY